MRYSNLTYSQSDVFKHSISQVKYLISILATKCYNSTIIHEKLSLFSMNLIHNFQFDMIFVAFYLLVLGSLVDQNLGCHKCEGRWVYKKLACNRKFGVGPCGLTRKYCVTDRAVSNHLLYIFVISFW